MKHITISILALSMLFSISFETEGYPHQIADAGDFLWFSTSSSIIKMDKSTGAMTVFDSSSTGYTMQNISSVATDRNNYLWMILRDHQAYHVVKYNGEKWIAFNSSNSVLPDQLYYGSIAVDSTGNIITNRYMTLYQYADSKWSVLSTPEGVSDVGTFNGISVDKNNDIWAGGKYSLFKYDRTQWSEYRFFEGNIVCSSIRAINWTWSGTLWCCYGNGSQGGRYGCVVKFEDNTWERFFEYGISPSSSYCYHQALTIDTNNIVWVCTAGAGLRKYDAGVWEEFTPSNSILPSTNFIDIIVDDNNVKWIYMAKTIVSFDDNEWKIFPIDITTENKKDTQNSSRKKGFAFNVQHGNSLCTFTYTVPYPANVSICLYDAKGKMRKSIYTGKAKKGSHRHTWHFDNERDRTIGAGIYLISFTSEDFHKSRHLVLIR